MTRHGLHYKLIRVFLLQIGLISLATLFGVFAAAKIVEDVLLRSALEGEAAHFWQLYQKDNAYPRPNTMNMTGFLAVNGDFSEVPPALRSLEPGYSRVVLNGRYPIVYLEKRDTAYLFLVFDEEQVSDLSFYFGVVPLSLVLILIYFFAWVSYRQTRKAISPMVKLARKVDQFNFRQQSIAELDLSGVGESSDHEVVILIDALDHFAERMKSFIDRERNFTRDASHELRTPLAVIKSSLALLQKRSNFQANEKRALLLIERTVLDMEGLIETLLLLAKEETSPLPEEEIVLNDLLATLIEQFRRSMRDSKVKLEVTEHSLVSLRAPEKVLSILFGNLLRNAISYTTEGVISVMVEKRQISIVDNGPGIEQEQLQKIFEPFYRGSAVGKGHGLGLAIVKRLCNRFDWSIKMRSKMGEGTSITIVFPKAKQIEGK